MIAFDELGYFGHPKSLLYQPRRKPILIPDIFLNFQLNFIQTEDETYLHGKNDHSDKPNPGMHAVEIGNRWSGQIVRIKHSLKANHRQNKGHQVNTSMDDFQLELRNIAARSVDQNS